MTSGDSSQLRQFAEQLEEIHPIAFRLAFGLTHEAAAEELGLEPQTMRSYLRKSPSRRVRKLAAAIVKRWLIEGRSLVDPRYLGANSDIALDTNFLDTHALDKKNRRPLSR